MRLPFDDTYARLGEGFFARVRPTPVRAPALVRVNRGLAATLGLDADALESPEGVAILAGNGIPEGADPIALAYAGHQFGRLVPQLGDGRAIMLGELVGTDGARRDLQLKGAGRTPFSRGGDGRAALGPVLREYVVAEAMAALGVPTTRALAAVTTGDPVLRDRPLPGAVLARVAASHLRIGTFEYFAVRRDRERLAVLVRYALARHYPDAAGSGEPALVLLERVLEAQAALVARWLGIGFVHGVMNTDNVAISGETLDYGPCAFLDEYDPDKTFSSIDAHGRYAFANQPRIAQWNLARLAEALLPLIADEEEDAVRLAKERLERFPSRFEAAHAAVLRAKLGLSRAEPEDLALAERLLALLARDAVDHTVFFRALCAAAADPAADARSIAGPSAPSGLDDWLAAWRRRATLEGVGPAARAAAMRAVNPALIPRNHRIEQVIAAAEDGDLAPFARLVRALERPYDDDPAYADLADPPMPEQRVTATFCGT